MKKNFTEFLHGYGFKLLAIDIWYLSNPDFDVIVTRLKDGKTYGVGVRDSEGDFLDVVTLFTSTDIERLDGFMQIVQP